MIRTVSGVEVWVTCPTVVGWAVLATKVIQWIMEADHPPPTSGVTWPPPMETCITTVIIDTTVIGTESVKKDVSDVVETDTERENVITEIVHRDISVNRRTVKYKVMKMWN